MKIAFISYEYPPDTSVGGIGTYVWQVSQLLVQRGHHVEVFAGSLEREIQEQTNGIIVHRVRVEQRSDFAKALFSVFQARHQTIQFDVIESPENGAEGRYISQSHPNLPLVVKLHTPSFMVSQLNHIRPSLLLRGRRFVGAIRRFQKPKPFQRKRYNLKHDPERHLALDADEITTPSVALGNHLIDQWRLDPKKVVPIPNPYIPNQSLLDIPVETYTHTVTFIGRLERRKGVVELAKAIPDVLSYFPQVKFRFIGQDHPLTHNQPSCQAHLEMLMDEVLESVEFTGQISLNEIPKYLAQTDICVFPSLWENFPNVCLEAMAAGRGVVGSSAGGMAEMLDQGKAGILIPPNDAKSISKALIELLSEPARRIQFGHKARARVVSEYSLERLGQLLEQSYQRAIQRRQTLGPRYTSTQKIYIQI